MQTKLTELLNIKYPIIQAPMFLVSNVAMVTEAMKAGVSGCIPALNYRTLDELREAMREHGIQFYKDVKLAMFEIDGSISIISGDKNLKQTHHKRKIYKTNRFLFIKFR